eukprot:403375174
MKMIKERSKTPESVMEKQLRRNQVQHTLNQQTLDSNRQENLNTSKKSIQGSKSSKSLKRQIQTFQELHKQAYGVTFEDLNKHSLIPNSSRSSREDKSMMGAYPQSQRRLLSARGEQQRVLLSSQINGQFTQYKNDQSSNSKNPQNYKQQDNESSSNSEAQQQSFNLMQSQIKQFRDQKKQQSMVNVSEILKEREKLSKKINQQIETIENAYSDLQPTQRNNSASMQNQTFQHKSSGNNINGNELINMQKRYSLKLNYEPANANTQQLQEIKSRNQLPSAYSIHSIQKQKIQNSHKSYINAAQITNSIQDHNQSANNMFNVNTGDNFNGENIQQMKSVRHLQSSRNLKNAKNLKITSESGNKQQKSITFLMQKKTIERREQDKSMNEYFNNKRQMSKEQLKTQDIVNRISSKERQPTFLNNDMVVI